MSPLVTDQRPIHSASRRWFASNELAELRIDLAQQSRNQKRDTYLTPKHTKSTKFTIKKYPDPFVLLCLKVFSICANHAAKAVSFSVLALRAANNAVITFRPFSVTM